MNEKTYKCPDCGAEMKFGYVFPTMPCDRLAWAPPESFKDGVFGKSLPMKELLNITDKGMLIQLGSGKLNDLLKGWSCRKCRTVIISAKK